MAKSGVFAPALYEITEKEKRKILLQLNRRIDLETSVLIFKNLSSEIKAKSPFPPTIDFSPKLTLLSNDTKPTSLDSSPESVLKIN